MKLLRQRIGEPWGLWECNKYREGGSSLGHRELWDSGEYLNIF